MAYLIKHVRKDDKSVVFSLKGERITLLKDQTMVVSVVVPSADMFLAQKRGDIEYSYVSADTIRSIASVVVPVVEVPSEVEATPEAVVKRKVSAKEVPTE